MINNKVFISYSHIDSSTVEELEKRLKENKIKIWIDKSEMKLGDSIIDKITDGINSSQYFMIILSRNSLASEWVKRELNATLMLQLNKKSIKILPIYLGIKPSEAPLFLQDIWGVEIDEQISDKAMKKIIEPFRDKDRDRNIKMMQDDFFMGVQYIDDVLNKKEPAIQDVNQILQLISRDYFRSYFIKKLKLINIDWYPLLKNISYFDVNTIPELQEVSDTDEKRTVVPFWEPLIFLEFISANTKDEDTINDLCGIMFKATSHIGKNPNKYNNQIFWYFIKIMVNIPIEYVNENFINLIPTWFNEKWDKHLLSSEIMEHLLPRLLKEDPKKALILIKNITEIKDNPNYTPPKNPDEWSFQISQYLILDEYWLMEGFKKHACLIIEKCGMNALKILLDNIKLVIEKNEEALLLEIKDKIVNISKVNNEIQISIDGVIISFLLGNDKIIYNTLFSDGNINKYFTTDKDKSKLFYNIKSLFNRGTRYSFREEHRYTTIPETIITDIILILIKEMISKDQYEEDLKNYIKINMRNAYLFYPKIALYIIGEKYEVFYKEFMNILESRYYNIFDSIELHDEIRNILDKMGNYKDTPETQEILKKLDDIISNIPIHHHAYDNPDGYAEEIRQRYYNALRWSDKFEEKITKETELAPAVRIIGNPMIGDSPKYTEEQINKMSLSTLKDKLINESELRNSDFEREFIKAIQADPYKYSSNLKTFKMIPYYHINTIYTALHEILGSNNKEQLDFKTIIEYLNELFVDPKFWSDEYSSVNEWGSMKHTEVNISINDFLLKAINYYPRIYQNYSNQLIQLVTCSLNKVFEERKSLNTEDGNARMGILTLLWGDIVISTMNVGITLLFHLMKESKEPLSPNEDLTQYKEKIYERLNRLLEKKDIRGYILLGYNLTNILFYDKGYITKGKPVIEQFKDEPGWKFFMEGFAVRMAITKESFEIMKNHYNNAINKIDVLEKDVQTIIGKQLLHFYIWEYEDLKDGLYGKLLLGNNSNLIMDTLYYLLSLKQYFYLKDEKYKKYEVHKIYKIWELLYEKCKELIEKGKLDKGNKEILSVLGNMIAFVERLDENNIDWIKLSAKYSHYKYSFSNIINSLYDIYKRNQDQITAKYISEIFLEMLSEFTPTYKEEHIKELVEFIYIQYSNNKDLDAWKNANEICQTYGKRGYEELLRGIYEKYNPK